LPQNLFFREKKAFRSFGDLNHFAPILLPKALSSILHARNVARSVRSMLLSPYTKWRNAFINHSCVPRWM